MTQLNKKLLELYSKILDDEYQGEKVWKRICNKELTGTRYHEGDLFSESKTRLMVVGTAVNGWEEDFNSCNSLESVVNIISNQKFDFSDVVNKVGFPSPAHPEKRNYHYRTSRFFKLIKYLLEVYGESDCLEDEYKTWYDDSMDWNCRIVWSNLYKVSPRTSGNPAKKLIKDQMQTYIDIIKEEIEEAEPKKVLFVPSDGYFEPWDTEPSFAKAFGIEMQDSENSFIIGSSVWNGIDMVVCKRPDKPGTKNDTIRQMAEEIKDRFEKR